MSNSTSTYTNPIDWTSDTSKPRLPNSGDDEPINFYKRNLFRNYRASYDVNPNTFIVFAIFPAKFDADIANEYESLELEYDKDYDLQSSQLSNTEGEIEAYLRENSQEFPGDIIEEKELFLHDSRHQGLTMNWKRARELYKNIYKE